MSGVVHDQQAPGAPGTASQEARASTARIGRYWIAAIILLLVGLLLSAELVRLHFEAAFDPEHHSYCSVNDTVSCDAVTRSKYSVVFGVPLAVWGVYGYAMMGITAIVGRGSRARAMAALLASLTGFALMVSLLLAAISHFLVHAWCLVCIGTYLVNLAVTIVAYRLLVTAGVRASYRALFELCTKPRWRTVASVSLSGGAALGLVLLTPATHGSAVLIAPPPRDGAAPPAASSAALESSSRVIPPLPPGVSIQQGETSDGLPWIGAENPVVTIVEFFDYQCSHCQQAFFGLHQLLERNPDRLRLVVRHFPLNPSCNRFISRPISPYACSDAKLANCARAQHRFWEAHEFLFKHSGDIEPKTFAADLHLDPKALRACLAREDEALARDVEAGIQLDLHGTPVFVVDGKPYMQRLPQSVVQELR